MGLQVNKVIDDHMHADCRILKSTKRKMLRESDQTEGDFYVIDTNDWVNVLAVTSNKKLFLSDSLDTAQSSIL